MRPASEIQHQVRQQIIQALEDDLDGDERIMKEVWETCLQSEDSEEMSIANAELHRIIAMLEEPVKLEIKNEYGWDQNLWVDGQHHSELGPSESITLEVTNTPSVEINKQGILVKTRL